MKIFAIDVKASENYNNIYSISCLVIEGGELSVTKIDQLYLDFKSKSSHNNDEQKYREFLSFYHKYSLDADAVVSYSNHIEVTKLQHNLLDKDITYNGSSFIQILDLKNSLNLIKKDPLDLQEYIMEFYTLTGSFELDICEDNFTQVKKIALVCLDFKLSFDLNQFNPYINKRDTGTLRKLFCKHPLVKHVRKIYGDEINSCGGKRNIYECQVCGKILNY